jgi:hypothetical protein
LPATSAREPPTSEPRAYPVEDAERRDGDDLTAREREAARRETEDHERERKVPLRAVGAVRRTDRKP